MARASIEYQPAVIRDEDSSPARLIVSHKDGTSDTVELPSDQVEISRQRAAELVADIPGIKGLRLRGALNVNTRKWGEPRVTISAMATYPRFIDFNPSDWNGTEVFLNVSAMRQNNAGDNVPLHRSRTLARVKNR